MNHFFERMRGLVYRVWDMYYDGFRTMTVGKRLWAIIIVKLVVIFCILKVFLFPDLLQSQCDSDEARASVVRRALSK